MSGFTELLAKILALLALTGPFLHIDFNHKKDRELLLLAASVKGGEFVFSNDHTYQVTFDHNQLYGNKNGKASLLGNTKIDEIMKSTPADKRTLANFHKLREFYEHLYTSFKVDVAKFASIGATLESTFITDKTPTELHTFLTDLATEQKELKASENAFERLRHESSRKLLELESSINGQDFFQKVYDEDRAEQSYVLQGIGDFPTLFTMLDGGKKK